MTSKTKMTSTFGDKAVSGWNYQGAKTITDIFEAKELMNNLKKSKANLAKAVAKPEVKKPKTKQCAFSLVVDEEEFDKKTYKQQRKTNAEINAALQEIVDVKRKQKQLVKSKTVRRDRARAFKMGRVEPEMFRNVMGVEDMTTEVKTLAGSLNDRAIPQRIDETLESIKQVASNITSSGVADKMAQLCDTVTSTLNGAKEALQEFFSISKQDIATDFLFTAGHIWANSSIGHILFCILEFLYRQVNRLGLTEITFESLWASVSKMVDYVAPTESIIERKLAFERGRAQAESGIEGVDWLQLIPYGGGIAVLIACLFFGKHLDGNKSSFDEFVKIGMMGRTVTSIASGVKSIETFMSWIVGYIRDKMVEYCPGLRVPERARFDKAALAFDVVTFSKEVEELVDPLRRVQVKSSPDTPAKLARVVLQSRILTDKIVIANEQPFQNSTASAWILDIKRRLMEFAKEMRTYDQKMWRPTPYVVQLMGPPGCGKSDTMTHLMETVTLPGHSTYTFDQLNKSYTRGSEAHWNLYNEQEVILIDDFLQGRGSTPKDSAALEFIMMVSCIPFPLEMAAIPDKGASFKGKLIFTSSNLGWPEILEVHEPAAVYRRRNLLIEMRPKQVHDPLDPTTSMYQLRDPMGPNGLIGREMEYAEMCLVVIRGWNAFHERNIFRAEDKRFVLDLSAQLRPERQRIEILDEVNIAEAQGEVAVDLEEHLETSVMQAWREFASVQMERFISATSEGIETGKEAFSWTCSTVTNATRIARLNFWNILKWISLIVVPCIVAKKVFDVTRTKKEESFVYKVGKNVFRNVTLMVIMNLITGLLHSGRVHVLIDLPNEQRALVPSKQRVNLTGSVCEQQLIQLGCPQEYLASVEKIGGILVESEEQIIQVEVNTDGAPGKIYYGQESCVSGDERTSKAKRMNAVTYRPENWIIESGEERTERAKRMQTRTYTPEGFFSDWFGPDDQQKWLYSEFMKVHMRYKDLCLEAEGDEIQLGLIRQKHRRETQAVYDLYHLRKSKGETSWEVEHKHSHACKSCGLKYVHDHPYRKVEHKQFDKQCPNEKCKDYHLGYNNRGAEMLSFEAEGSMDQMSCDIFNGAIKNNMCIVTRELLFEDKICTAKIRGLGLCGKLLLMPSHFFSMYEDEEEYELMIQDNTAVRREVIKHKDIVHLGRDTCMVRLSKVYPSFKDLRGYFIAERDIGKLENIYVRLGVFIKPSDYNCESGLSILHTKETKYGTDSNYTTLAEKITYDINTEKGWCGSPVMVMNPAIEGKICGLHVGSVKNGGKSFGFAAPISKEFLTEMMRRYKIEIDWITHNAEGLLEEALTEITTSATFEPQGTVRLIAQLKGKYAVWAPVLSQIKPSLLHGKIFSVKTEPSVLIPSDKRLDADVYGKSILGMSMDKYTIPKLGFNDDHLQLAQEMAFSIINSVNPVGITRRVLTEHEMINGVPAAKYDRLNMKTSAGLPFKRSKPAGTSGKYFLFDEVEKDVYEMKDYLKSCVERRELLAKKGERVYSYAVSNLKDERRKPEKIKRAKTRNFQCMPTDYNLLCRKYFGAFIAAMNQNHATLPSSVGVDPCGATWSHLAMRMKRFGGKVFAGDFEEWDGKFDPKILAVTIPLLINRWYNDGEENAQVRRVLCDEAVFTWILTGNILAMKTQGIPSGIPMTVDFNSLGNLLYFLCAFIHLARKNNFSFDPSKIMDYVDWIFTGDDHVIAPREDIQSWFNFHTVKEFFNQHGLGYTDATKSMRIVPPLEDLSEVTYLKRRFVEHPKFEGKYLAPLNMDSLTELTNWIRKGGDDKDMLQENLSTLTREMHQHGKTKFQEVVTAVNACLTHENTMVENLERPWKLMIDSFEQFDYEWQRQFD